MKVLITGATGFIGSYLMELCAAQGDDVTGTSLQPTTRPEDTAAFADRTRRMDINGFEQVLSVLRDVKPDVIYHLAAQSYPALSWSAPIETFNTNVIGSTNLFEAVKALGLNPRIVVACSSAQYGIVRQEDVPVPESHPQKPVHPYGVSKAAKEMLTVQYALNDGIQGIPARIFNTTGPRKTGDVCADFTQRMVRIERGLEAPVLKVGNLTTLRALSDVRDTAAALMALAAKGRAGEAYNVSASKTILMQDVLNRVVELGKVKVSVEQDPALMRPTDEPVIFGDSTKLTSETGWTAKYDIRQTIGDMMDYWRKVLQ
jgi:GDP-4-dehydro-6-deoxy-D-mannose reductase